MKKTVEIIIIVGFFLFLVSVSLLTVFLPKKSFSDMENRLLASFPKITFTSIENKKAMNGVENYISDHFPLRIQWVEVKTDTEIAIGKKDINGVYILKSRFTEKITAENKSTVNNNVSGINTFAKRVDTPVFICLVPTSAAIYADELPEYAPNLDQKAFINSVYNKLLPDVKTISIYDILQTNRENYIYYRTDHHWTTEGAFLAYNQMGKRLGFTPFGLESFDIEHASNDFYGSLYSKVLYNGIEPDTVDIFHSNTNVNVTDVEVTTELGKEPDFYDSVYFREYLDKKDKYPVFLGDNQPLVTIHSTSKGGRLLVIKDSYANCLLPFLTEHYSSITALDMRYIGVSLDEVIDPESYDQILILYNVSSFNSDVHLRKLGV